ncbi:MAG: dTMP kinase [Myxococcota bacterium]
MIEGHFIVIEGIDGSGTSTQAAMLGRWFRGRGLPVLVTHEPTDGPIGSIIRQILTHRLVVCGMTGPRAPTWATMTLLFAADRLDHLESSIQPNLLDGVNVISDRYDLSSIAYQSAVADDPNMDISSWVRTVNSRARRPDLTIVVDVDPAIAAERRAERAYTTELYEDNSLQQALAEAYVRAEDLVPGDNVVHVDGNADEQTVHAAIVAAVMALRGDKG